MGFIDNLQNLAAQLGVGKSKLAADTFALGVVSDIVLTNMYRSDWMSRKIIDIPVPDMLRPWRAWNATDKLITAIEDAEKRHAVKAKVMYAMKAARLYGGAGILIGADTGNPAQPLNIDRIGKGQLRYLTVLPRRVLTPWSIVADPQSPDFGLPQKYQMSTTNGGTIDIHPSRVLRFVGNDRLDFDLNADGWGDSILFAIYDAIHNAALTQTGIAEMVHEAKIDVISVENLGAQLANSAGTDALVKRFRTAATLKSINNMLLLDAKEKWDRKQTSFTTLPDVLDRYLQIVAGAADIPATRLLGVSPKGLGSTGEHDQTNYYDMLASVREDHVTPILARLDRILWRDAIGAEPDGEVFYEWRPLWQPTEKERADVAKTKADTTKVYMDIGILPDDAMAKGIANQLIEDGVYPGIEAELAKVQSAPDGFGEDETEDDPPAPGKPKRGG